MLQNRWIAYLVLALILTGTGLYGLWQHAEAQALATENKRLSEALGASEEQARERAKVDPQQALARNKAGTAIRRKRQELKEKEDAEEPRPTASAGQLDRLRELTEAGNASIRAASELH